MSAIETDSLAAATLEWIDRFAPYGVVATDREFRVRSWNQWMKSHSGFDLDKVLNQKITEIFPDLVTRRLEGHFHRALQGEVSVLSTALHGHLFPLRPGSRETEFEWMKQTARIAPLVSKGEIHGVIIVLEDVTQREWQAEILRRQHARDEILSWALAHLLKSDDPRRVSRELFCKVAAHLDFDSYLLFLIEGDPSVFRLSAAGGVTQETEASIRTIPTDRIPWITTAKEGQAVIRQRAEIETNPAFEIGKSLGFHAYIVLPLIAGSAILGFLCFATRSRDKVERAEADLLGTIAQYLAVALNREKTDRELREAQKKLNEHALQLEEKIEERTASLKLNIAELQTFSYTVAHDLRAPIRALKGYSEALLEDFSAELPPEAVRLAGKLRDSSIRMDSLTRDLLEFSKISRQEIQLGPVKLEEVIADVLSSSGPATAQFVEVDRPLPEVLGQRTFINQCLANLMENSIKFVGPGQTPQIKIRAEIVPATSSGVAHDTTLFSRSRYSLLEKPQPSQTTSRVKVWFEDQGIGIPREARNKIFGIFERGVNANEYDGTGIGLAIVARAMERMGGNCGVESEPGKGSRFWLEFRMPSNQAA